MRAQHDQPNGSVRATRSLAVVAVAGFVVGLIVSVTPRTDGSGEVQDFSVLDPRLDPISGNVPLLRDGQQVDLSTASAMMPFPIYRPQMAENGDGTIKEIWVLGGPPPEVAIRYISGLRVYLTTWPQGQDPPSFYQSQAEESGVGSYQMINGYPAYVVAADAQAPGYPSTSVVDVTAGNVEISLHANMPVDELVETAATATVASAGA